MTGTDEHAHDWCCVWVCVDCYWIHHYGDIAQGHRDADATEERNAEYLAAYERLSDGPGNVFDNTDSETGEGIDEFSWKPCQCCGSPLGGSRFRLHIDIKEIG